MVRRLILGLVFGLIVGAALAAGLVRLGMPTFLVGGGEIVAYLTAAATGALTGLVAGKPIWAGDAKVEGSLKALFGALMGVGAMFALRQWGTGVDANLSFLGAGGPAPIGDLPAASLPLIAAVLGGLFGLDNTDTKPDEGSGAARKRISAGAGAGRDSRENGRGAPVADADDDEPAEVVSTRAKR
jgi:hypothetical protein